MHLIQTEIDFLIVVSIQFGFRIGPFWIFNKYHSHNTLLMLPFLRFTENNIPLLFFNQRFLNSIKIADSKWVRGVERRSAPEMLEKISGSKRLSCNAGHQEFGRCCTRGESEGWDQRQGL